MRQKDTDRFEVGDQITVKGVRSGILSGSESFEGSLLRNGESLKLRLYCKGLTESERQILADGCLINYYANKLKEG